MKNRNDTTIDNNHNSIYNNDNNNTNNCIDKDENDNITSYPVVCMIRPATTLVQNNIIYPIKRRILWNIKISSDIFWSRNFFERSQHHLTFSLVSDLSTSTDIQWCFLWFLLVLYLYQMFFMSLFLIWFLNVKFAPSSSDIFHVTLSLSLSVFLSLSVCLSKPHRNYVINIT